MVSLLIVTVLFILLGLVPLLVVPEDARRLLSKSPSAVVFVGAMCVFIGFGWSLEAFISTAPRELLLIIAGPLAICVVAPVMAYGGIMLCLKLLARAEAWRAEKIIRSDDFPWGQIVSRPKRPQQPQGSKTQLVGRLVGSAPQIQEPAGD